jgi:hypothetical protein
MNVVGRHGVIEHRQTKTFLCLEHPMQVTAPVRVPRLPESTNFAFLDSAKRLELSVAMERLEPLELSSVLITT